MQLCEELLCVCFSAFAPEAQVMAVLKGDIAVIAASKLFYSQKESPKEIRLLLLLQL